MAEYPVQGSTPWGTALKQYIDDLVAGVSRNRGAWAANTAYKANDEVTRDGVLYAALADFTSAATFNSANWLVLSTQVGTPAQTGLLRGLPSAFTNVATPKGGIQTVASGSLGATYRTKHQAVMALTTLQATYVNWHKAVSGTSRDVIGENAITIEVTWFKNGVAIPLLFDGQRSKTYAPGESVTTDQKAVTIDAGDVLYEQVYVSVAATGMAWPLSRYGQAGNNEGSNYGTDRANLNLTELAAFTNGYTFSCIAAGGKPASPTPKKMVLLCGDSQTQGFAQGTYGGTTAADDYGYAQRACQSVNSPYVSIAYFGETVTDFLVGVNRQYRMPVADNIGIALVGYGWNDLKTRTAVQIETDLITCWNIWKARGAKVISATILPNTASTDAWATLANQTLVTTGWSQTERNALNAWHRDGAPFYPGGAPAAVGATGGGVLRIGNAQHPVAAMADIAAAVEDTATGKWKVAASAPHYTSDGIHGSPLANAAMAAAFPVAELV